MTIDPKAFKRGIDDTLMKEAGLWDDLGAAYRGAQMNTQDLGFMDRLRSPFKTLGRAYDGAKAGFAGKVMNEQTAGLQQQGVSFTKDQFGRLQGINLGDTVKNYAGNLLGGNTMNFLDNHKWKLLGGAGALAGGWMLKNMIAPRSPKRQYAIPQSYIMPQQQGLPMVTPQAIQKFGSFGFLPSALAMPTMAANLVTNGPDFDGLRNQIGNLGFGFNAEEEGVGQPKSQAPKAPEQPQQYQPVLKTDNPDLKRLLHDPRMRDYLTGLIKQVELERKPQIA